jgi:Uma2 family endonuclease
MAAILEKPEANVVGQAVAIHFPKETPLDDKALLALSSANPDLRLERTTQGELIVMSPTGGKSSRRNAALVARLFIWAEKDGSGTVFDSSGGFSLPNGAVRAPDACWVSNEQLAKLTDEELEAYPPLCPEFVIELRSATDTLKSLQEKMEEYIANGTKLGWLLDAKTKNVYVYTPEGMTLLEHPEKLAATGNLQGFVLDLLEVW